MWHWPESAGRSKPCSCAVVFKMAVEVPDKPVGMSGVCESAQGIDGVRAFLPAACAGRPRGGWGWRGCWPLPASCTTSRTGWARRRPTGCTPWPPRRCTPPCRRWRCWVSRPRRCRCCTPQALCLSIPVSALCVVTPGQAAVRLTGGAAACLPAASTCSGRPSAPPGASPGPPPSPACLPPRPGPGRAIITEGFQALARGAPDMNSLVGLGATASFAVSAVAALLPRLGGCSDAVSTAASTASSAASNVAFTCGCNACGVARSGVCGAAAIAARKKVRRAHRLQPPARLTPPCAPQAGAPFSRSRRCCWAWCWWGGRWRSGPSCRPRQTWRRFRWGRRCRGSGPLPQQPGVHLASSVGASPANAWLPGRTPAICTCRCPLPAPRACRARPR